MFDVPWEPAPCAPYLPYQLILLSASLASLSIAAFILEFAEVLPARWKATRAGLPYDQPRYSKTYLPGLAKVHLLYACASEVHHN